MKFHVMTLFPDMVMNGLNTSIIGRAIDNGLLSIDCVDIRKYTNDRHNHVDDYPYGGGAGMVMQAQPIYDCYMDIVQSNNIKKPRVVFMTPTGNAFNQQMSRDFAQCEDIIFLCGHYEGIDERVIDMIVTDNVSIGDYVLTGGELPAMVMIDSISRNIKGVLSNDMSAITESFSTNLLEYPQYTRPPEFMGKKVPDVLLSGNHKNIEKWRYEQSVERTKKWRPDLLNDK